MKVGIVGAGYVSDFYAATIGLHPELDIVAVTDLIEERSQALARRVGAKSVSCLAELLDNDSIDVVVNLTDPSSHHFVTECSLMAGKHVYTEKPLSTDICAAQELAELASRNGVHLLSAPCSLLGETAQTIWRLLRNDVVGKVRLVYAEMDDGMLHRMNFRSWRNSMGIPWPYRDEMRVGCTAEHAGYYLSWLVAFFGSAVAVTSFASTQVSDKVIGEHLGSTAPDISVGCIEFASGVVARLTCSVLAPHDHSLRIIGDDGVLTTDDCWDYRSPVSTRRWINIGRRTMLSPNKRRHDLVQSGYGKPQTGRAASMDYWRGVADLTRAVAEGRPPRLGLDLTVHVNELTLAIESGGFGAGRYEMTTKVGSVEPMSWAL